MTSAVLRAEVRKTPPVVVEDEKFFFRVVYAAFALRRKTIVNSLMTGFGSRLTKEQVTEAVVSAGLTPTVREAGTGGVCPSGPRTGRTSAGLTAGRHL